MDFKLKKSLVEKNVWEIWEGESVVKEISMSFSVKKIPASFASQEDIEQWLIVTEQKLVRQRAYSLMAARNYSSVHLLRKLQQKGFALHVCQGLVDELKDHGLLKDDEFICALIEREFRSGHGPRYIEAKLRFRGLAIDQVRKIVTDEKQYEAMVKLIKKIPRNPAAALQRRGFDMQLIQRVLWPRGTTDSS